MDVLHISAADLEGGAARAAYRIHKSLLKYRKTNEVNSLMRVISKKSDDESVLGGYPIYTNKIWTKLAPHLNKIPKIGFKTDNPATHTISLVSSGLGKEMEKRYKKNKKEILNIYWIGDKTISINEISKLRQTTVWTLFDQWAFSGAEHYQAFPDNKLNKTERFIHGYSSQNRPKNEKGIDINRLVWETKKRAFKNPINIVCCSNWLALLVIVILLLGT